MDEVQLQNTLAAMLLTEPTLEDPDGGGEVVVENVQTFAEAGLMTNNAGLVVKMEDGTEFQLQVVQRF